MFELLQGGALPYPSRCVSCGDNGRDCLDFRVNADFGVDIGFGAVLLCTECITAAVMEHGTALGMARRSEAELNRIGMEQWKAVSEEYPSVLEGFADELSAIASNVRSLAESRGIDRLNADSASELEESEGDSDEDSGDKRQASKPVKQQDSAGVSGDPINELFSGLIDRTV